MKKTGYILMVFSLLLGCIEEIPVDVNLEAEIDVGAILIVEATITDEFIQQKIKLSRATSFANDSMVEYEKNATVTVVDKVGNTIQFNNVINGDYLSSEPFDAVTSKTYKLLITTTNGEIYESNDVVSAGKSVIDNIRAERRLSNNGVDGIAILVDASNTNFTKGYYKYEYQETYKIIAPNWDPFEFVISDEGGFFVAARTQEERTCFNTINSNEIIQSNVPTNDLTKFQVRFLGQDNFIISHRYSILVRQQLQSSEAFEFYNLLNSFSSSENVFSEIQPGLLEGNIRALNSDNKVIGFFDVVSMAEKRLFFNYEDLFNGEDLPPYIIDCRMYVPSSFAIDDIFSGTIEFAGNNEEPGPGNLPYFVTQRACGDCTVLGSNVIPEFWIEE